MTRDVEHYSALFRTRLEPIAMRELYIEQSGFILDDKDRQPAEKLIDQFTALHRAFYIVYAEWFAQTDRRPK